MGKGRRVLCVFKEVDRFFLNKKVNVFHSHAADAFRMSVILSKLGSCLIASLSLSKSSLLMKVHIGKKKNE